MHQAFFILLMLPCLAIAGDWRDGDAQFKPNSKHASQLAISWVVTRNVQEACEAESKRRGLGGFRYGVAACSFWTSTACMLVTSQLPTMHQLGHELRHCFDHSFH